MSRARIILVEDEPLLAMMMEDMLADLGCEVAASFGALGAALSWLADQEALPDGAVLDVNLGGGETVFPLAEALRVRGVPFAFVTGYGVLPSDRFPDSPLIHKPVYQDQLLRVVQAFASAA